MARHRNVRTMNYEDEYYDDDDYLGHSVEDNYCVSPGTAAQFTFNRDRDVNFASYMGQEKIPEEEENESEGEPGTLNDSGGGQIKSRLNDLEQGKLNSCLEEVRNVLGDTVPEHIMCQAIVKNNFHLEASLNELLTPQAAPKPQRQPRVNRRNRSQEFAPNPPTVQLKTPQKKPVQTENKETGGGSVQVKVATTKEPVRGFCSPAKLKSDVIDNGTEDSVKSRTDSDINDWLGTKNFTSSELVTDNSCKAGLSSASTDSINDTESKNSVQSYIPKKEVSTPVAPKSVSKSKQDKAKMKEEYDRRKSGKELLNLVVIGHVDAGKSTLMGHLLYQLGNVNKKAMHKYEQESRKVGKGSFAYAWVLDETEEERSRGVTMDIAQTKFETPHKIITLLDAPGHKDFIPNMITGTAQADVGILVVNATRGEFETGFDSGGQTREHALLARSLGVSQLIVAVNKMDTVDWSRNRYDEVTKKLGQFLKTAGYREGDISFIPCSGLSGENLAKSISEPKLSEWYKGSTLVEQIDKFKTVTRPIDKPLRMSIADVFKGMGSGFSVTGRIGAGSVQTTDKVLVMPCGETATVKGITMEDQGLHSAFAGDHVTLTLTGLDMANVNVGNVLCDPANPSKSVTRIRARIVIFNLEIPITKGFTVVFHYQSITEPAVIKRLISQLNKNTGEVLKNRPKCLVKNSSAVIEIEFERAICLELYKDYKDLGRFMLRYGGSTIAAGLVEEVLKGKSKSEDPQGASAAAI